MQQEFRDVYKSLQEEDKFEGFDVPAHIIPLKFTHVFHSEFHYYRKRYLDKHNLGIIGRVVKEVKGIDSPVPTFQNRGQCSCNLSQSPFTRVYFCFAEAGKHFFQTKVEEESLKSQGKYDEKVVKQRKLNHLTRVR